MIADTLTPRQHDLLAFIRSYRDEKGGVAPSFEEMRVALGLSSKSGVHRLMQGLAERGHIYRRYNKHRSIELLDERTFTLREASLTDLAGELAARGYGIRKLPTIGRGAA